MTSEEYAKLVEDEVSRFCPDITDAERRMQEMAVSRALAGGQEYALSADRQSFEVKPFADLLMDVREEAADIINYAVAIIHRVPSAAHIVRPLIAYAMWTNTLCDKLEVRS